MIYKEFENIDIDNALGVSPVGDDTKLLAKHTSKLKFNSALEIGTGTGFIPIYLKKLGFNCIGIDINKNAIKYARKNAEKNNVNVEFLVSDLFDKVRGRFDIIIFNPPYGNVKSSFLSRYLELIKSLLPKGSCLIGKISYPIIKNQRKSLLKDFFRKAPLFLKKNGKIMIYLHSEEMNLVKSQSFKMLDNYMYLRLLLISDFRA